jgi:uncharacterized membrane protein
MKYKGFVLIAIGIFLIALGITFLGLNQRKNIGKVEVYSIFKNYGKIPIKYTCDGLDISPPI